MRPTPEDLHKEFSYDPESGHLVRRSSQKRLGSRSHGYLRAYCRGRQYGIHRIAFAMTEGRWPSGEIDHINGIGTDNRRSNLREATKAENGRNRGANKNNTSGFKGVTWCRTTGRWVAQIVKNRRNIFLGRFDTPEEAAAARQKAEALHYGVFAPK